MKRFKYVILIFILGLLISPFLASVKAENEINIHFFHSSICTSCQDMEDYLLTLEEDYDNINIIYYEKGDSVNDDLLYEVAEAFDIAGLMPTVVIGGLAFSGHNSQVEADIESTIIRYSTDNYVDVVEKILNGETLLVTDFDVLERDTLNLPVIGEVAIEDVSLMVGAIVLGFIDGLNPCAMWVLLFLITMLISMKDRKRMWIIGITFLASSAFVYMIIMFLYLGMTKEFLSSTSWFRIAIGIFAVGFGGYNISKFIKTRNQDVGCEVTTQKSRSKIIEKIKAITKKQNLLIALVGVVILAATVNLIELACSAGLPLLFSSILAYNDVSMGLSFLYVGVYILFFLIDDIIIFTIAMVTMKVTGISNKYSRYSSIIGGVLMVLIGILLIFFPKIIMFNF